MTDDLIKRYEKCFWAFGWKGFREAEISYLEALKHLPPHNNRRIMDRIVGHEVYRSKGLEFIGGWHWMHPQCTAKFAKLVPELEISFAEVPLSDYTDEVFPNIDKCDFCKKPIRGRHKGTH